MFRIIHLKGDVFRIIHRKMYSWWEIFGGYMFRIICLKGDMFYIPEAGFFRSTDFSFYLLNQFDWSKMT